MADFTPEFFENAKNGVVNGKIAYLNMAGVVPEVCEKNHAKFRLPVDPIHMNHVGIVYAGSYFIIAESAGATLLKCVYGSKYTAIIKSVSIDYTRPCKSDLVVDLSMTDEEAKERIAYVEEHGKGRYPMEIPVMNTDGEVCANVSMVYYLMANN